MKVRWHKILWSGETLLRYTSVWSYTMSVTLRSRPLVQDINLWSCPAFPRRYLIRKGKSVHHLQFHCQAAGSLTRVEVVAPYSPLTKSQRTIPEIRSRELTSPDSFWAALWRDSYSNFLPSEQLRADIQYPTIPRGRAALNFLRSPYASDVFVRVSDRY